MTSAKFLGKDICVGYNGFTGPTAFVTFTSILNSSERVDPNCWSGFQLGFGEKYFAKKKQPAIHVVSMWNHWWNTTEMDEALEVVCELLVRFEKVVLYGASMGGYGALLSARKIGAQVVIASCPQVFVDFDRGSFDNRWMELRQKISFVGHDIPRELANFKGELHVLYDPKHEKDRKQVDFIDNFFAHEVRHAGHFLLETFNKAGVLDDLISNLVGGREVGLQIRIAETFALHEQVKLHLGSYEGADLYRELALLFEDSDPDFALSLICRACEYRPGGGFIMEIQKRLQLAHRTKT